MKKMLFFAVMLFTITTASFAAGPKISEKALKAFKTTFGDVANPEWSEIDHVYMVKFIQQGISTYVKYDEEGNFISSRRYYFADQLPIDIQCKLKKKFSDKTVFGVTEFTAGDDVNYYIKLQDDKNWLTVKIDGARNMEVTEKYRKL